MANGGRGRPDGGVLDRGEHCGSGLITLPQMVRAGFLLNLALVPVVVLLLWILGPYVFGIEIDMLPDWVG